MFSSEADGAILSEIVFDSLIRHLENSDEVAFEKSVKRITISVFLAHTTKCAHTYE